MRFEKLQSTEIPNCVVKVKVAVMRTNKLTLSAVLAPPALQALAVPLVVAGEVSEGVVAGPAVGGARLAVVELVAHHVVGVTQLALVAKVHVLGPFLTHGQPAAGRQPADEVVLVLWVKRGRRCYCVCQKRRNNILKNR